MHLRQLSPFRSTEKWLPALVAVAAIVPFVLFNRQFGQLYWFGDEWDLLDQIDRMGVWQWSWQVFAENFVPVFKLLWAGAVHLGGGSYLFMLGCLWCTHALNTYLFGRLLRSVGMGWTGVLAGQVLFALPPQNWETLAWSVQWSAMLSTCFLLMSALLLVPLLRQSSHLIHWTAFAGVFICCLFSAWSFSRGVLTGILVAAGWLLVVQNGTVTRRLLPAVIFVVPSALTAVLIASFSSGNHQHMDGHLVDAIHYALCNFLLNPFHALLGTDSWGPYTTVLLSLLKLALISWGLWRAPAGLRLFLLLAVVFDLGNAALLGIGRYHTGILTAISSRYQYGSLLATAPFLAFWLEQQIGRCRVAGLHLPVKVTVLSLLLLIGRGWHGQISLIIPSRGTAPRETLAEASPASRFDVAGIPSMSLERARQVAEKFHLH